MPELEKTRRVFYGAVLASPASFFSQQESLAEIMLRASTLAGDRRHSRYSRLRKAVASGLEDRSVLSAKQPKGKVRRNKLTKVNEAVEPDLPDEVRQRLINLYKDEKDGI